MKTEVAIEKFSEMIIKSMERQKSQKWQKGWIGGAYGVAPFNFGSKREYNACNAFMLFMVSNFEGWQYPAFGTFKQVKAAGGSIKKGEESCPVLFWSIRYEKDGRKLTSEEYDELTRSEQEGFIAKPFLKSYNVFNIDQTDLKETNPKLYNRVVDRVPKGEYPKDTFGMYENAEIDDMLTFQKWLCPITYNQPSSQAFYAPSKDKIVVPMKSQFRLGNTDDEIYISGQRWYDVILHEMAHSTGSANRLNRVSGTKFADKGYAKEELVAELTAAMCGQVLGFDSRISDNNARYLDHWIGVLRKEPKFIVSVLADVNKASQMILDVVYKERASKQVEIA